MASKQFYELDKVQLISLLRSCDLEIDVLRKQPKTELQRWLKDWLLEKGFSLSHEFLVPEKGEQFSVPNLDICTCCVKVAHMVQSGLQVQSLPGRHQSTALDCELCQLARKGGLPEEMVQALVHCPKKPKRPNYNFTKFLFVPVLVLPDH